MPQVADCCAENRDGIDAGMTIEAMIFDRDNRMLEIG
jgi:hypothetical protein